MTRRLLNLLTALSLLLCVAACMMWMRSDRKRDCLSASGPHWASAVESDAGRLSVVITWYEAPKPLPCSYDLRATPDRCPECGTEAKALA